MVREVADRDVKRALALVNAVFSEFVAVNYSEEGIRTFESYLQNKIQEVSAELKSGHKKMWAYYQGDEIIGVIATRETAHISLMFVEKSHQRKGIARQMFRVVAEEIKKDKNAVQITVNSSPYAVKVYERLGFVKTQEQQEKDGIVYIPMRQPL